MFISLYFQMCFSTTSNGLVSQGCVDKTDVPDFSQGGDDIVCNEAIQNCTYYCNGSGCNEQTPNGNDY